MKKDTLLVHAGRDPSAQNGVVNPPVYRASTVLFPTLEALESASRHPFDQTYYGRYGTPTTVALEEAVAALEGAHRAVATSSGLAAIAVALLAFVSAGDHILVSDNVYGPTRKFCDSQLKRFGVETTYFDPLIGAGITELMHSNTRLVFLESPGSLTFEVSDVPLLAQAARSRGIRVLMDNTWATPLYFDALEHGVDVSIHAATKYLVGHADAMLGIINTTQETFNAVKRSAVALGNCPGSEECALALRGLRTLSVRLARHQATAWELATWLSLMPQVKRVLHPALPDHPGHEFWKRDFRGASGLFGVVLEPVSKQALAAMVDGLALFGMGFSWGGYESLILPVEPEKMRSATSWQSDGVCLRIHAGLEDIDDLKADLAAGFARLDDAM
ncbi:MAG: cystathionine beta-lyase [Pseudomonadota bacterium]|nr:cystathionine beta-lyase [Pseudomonadota bacterium]